MRILEEEKIEKLAKIKSEMLNSIQIFVKCELKTRLVKILNI